MREFRPTEGQKKVLDAIEAGKPLKIIKELPKPKHLGIASAYVNGQFYLNAHLAKALKE